MQFIAARAGDDVDSTAGVAAGFGSAFSLRGKLDDRVHWKNHPSNPRYTALIHRWNVVPEVVVIHAVNLPIDLVGTRAI